MFFMANIRVFLEEIFYALTGAILILFALELAWQRIVLAYFNLNWLLLVWLATGLGLLFFKKQVN